MRNNNHSHQAHADIKLKPAHVLFSATLSLLFGLLLAPGTSIALNWSYIYYGMDNVSIDNTQSNGTYALLNKYRPASIALTPSMVKSNIGPFGNLSRINLQAITPALNSTMSKTYITNEEFLADCPGLSVEFFPTDARETVGGGYIICGRVRRDGESTPCSNLPAYHGAFLLKLDASGGFLWYKRYGNGDIEFNSVVEDPGTGNIIVCGNKGGAFGGVGYHMSVDGSGNFIQAHEVDGYTFGSTNYNEITWYGGSYVLVSSVFSVNPVEGGILITVVDASGAPMISRILKCYDQSNVSITGTGVNDAYDNDLVFTGAALDFNTYEHSVYVAKFDPWLIPAPPSTFTPTFVYSYPAGKQVYASSITIPFMTANIYVTGRDASAGQAFILDVSQGSPGTARYDYDAGVAGRSITSDGIAIYSGNVNPSVHTFAVKDNWGHPGCGSEDDLTGKKLKFDVHYAGEEQVPEPVTEVETLLEVNLSIDESPYCGSPKKGVTGVNKLAGTGQIVLSPNPANDNLDIQMPDAFKNGNLKVTDVTGRVVLSQSISNISGTVHLDISKISAGMYLLSIDGNGIQKQARFLKQQ